MPAQTMEATSTAVATTAPKKKPSSSSIFSLKCGCKGAKSVSISHSRSASSDKSADAVATISLSGLHNPPPSISAGPDTSSAERITFTTTTTTTTSTSHDNNDEEEAGDESPRFSGLLRQLSELERNIAAWDRRRRVPSGLVLGGELGEKEVKDEARRCTDVAGYDRGREKGPGFDSTSSHLRGQHHHGHGRHRRSKSEGGGVGSGRVLGKVGESVAVVKQTEDPLGDFRRSMLQMIVEKEILSGEELRELLCRFLALNSPSHHALIIRAFADIWRDVFSGYSDAAVDLLLLPPAVPRHHRLPPCGRNRRVTSGGFPSTAAAAPLPHQ